jgi:AraC-like DNA-binding protein
MTRAKFYKGTTLLFSRWAGTSPKRFLQFLTIQHAKQLLADSQSVLDATYEAGLSSPSRLHDLFVTHEAITPGEFKQKGAGLTIQYGFHDSPVWRMPDCPDRARHLRPAICGRRQPHGSAGGAKSQLAPGRICGR